MNYYNVGQNVIVGGSLGPVMRISDIKENGDMILNDESSTMYWHVGDCTLIPLPLYAQLDLFDYEEDR